MDYDDALIDAMDDSSGPMLGSFDEVDQPMPSKKKGLGAEPPRTARPNSRRPIADPEPATPRIVDDAPIDVERTRNIEF